MSAKRHRSPVTISTAPRSTLPDVHHKDVDAILKDLRLCSRRIKAVLDSFDDELRLLERLYYKCKNQHRMTLFFKRVPEIRRYGRRLNELNVAGRVDLLRASFVGLDHTHDQKALRGSWSRVPGPPYVHFLTERLTACSTLVCKMRDRLEKAYHQFSLAMQTGAFVQLIILFVAISSRMSVLLSELEEALQLSISTCNHLLTIIHPAGKNDATIIQQFPSELEMMRPPYIDHDVISEDTGQTVSRREPVEASTYTVEDLGMKTGATMEIQVMPPSGRPTNVEDHTAAPTLKKAAIAKANQKNRVKKAKKRLDEIDEIFGF